MSDLSTRPLPLTETVNPATADIDAVDTLEMARQMNAQDALVSGAVAKELEHIAAVIDAAAGRMLQGGRLIYAGAGTSGRLGVLDAAEMPPTFSTPPEQVIGLIAGGERAITKAVEGAEDDAEAGERDLSALKISELDSLIGLSASGRTPYVLGAMRAAKARGAFVASLACSHPSLMGEIADVAIAPLVGPEVIAGSTRLKAGTAEKLVLNMISTGVMIRLGKTFGNLMVDVQATNVKLRDRSSRIVAEACHISRGDAEALLAQCNGEVKTAIVTFLAKVPADQARGRLKTAGGSVRQALKGH
jgi:N-acetylmuramic acid 6-phosphate etherase